MPKVVEINHPLLLTRLAALRDKSTNHELFRTRLHEVGQLMAYEITRELEVEKVDVETPLGPADGHVLARDIILVPILRAGLGMLHGILQILPEARVGHIGMSRDEATLRPTTYYNKLPENIATADVLLIDPMLATGQSSADAVDHLKRSGARHLRFICLVSCSEGIARFHDRHPDVPIYTAAIDGTLTDQGYIYPGLGDAGDRYFGT